MFKFTYVYNYNVLLNNSGSLMILYSCTKFERVGKGWKKERIDRCVWVEIIFVPDNHWLAAVQGFSLCALRTSFMILVKNSRVVFLISNLTKYKIINIELLLCMRNVLSPNFIFEYFKMNYFMWYMKYIRLNLEDIG